MVAFKFSMHPKSFNINSSNVHIHLLSFLQVGSINDRSDYRAVENALKTINFKGNPDVLWQLLAAILHLVSACT